MSEAAVLNVRNGRVRNNRHSSVGWQRLRRSPSPKDSLNTSARESKRKGVGSNWFNRSASAASNIRHCVHRCNVRPGQGYCWKVDREWYSLLAVQSSLVQQATPLEHLPALAKRVAVSQQAFDSCCMPSVRTIRVKESEGPHG